jgi:hypothetical protein
MPQALRLLHRRAVFTAAAAGTALVLGASAAFAAATWTIVTAPPTGANATLQGVATVSDSDAWAVGFRNGAANTNIGAKVLIDNWNGTAWSQVTTPATPGNTALLNAVSASGASDAWAVGRTQVNKSSFEALGLHWNGTAWSVSSGLSAALFGGTYAVGVADISATDAYAIGDNSSLASGELAQWNGSGWARVTYPLPTDTGFPNTLNAIAANGPNDVWIVGSYMIQVSQTNLRYETFSLHWNGSTWSVVSMPLVSGSDTLLAYEFSSVVVNSPTDVWAVGGSGDHVIGLGGSPSNTLIEHWNGTAWSIVPSPSPGSNARLTGVTTSNAASSIWAVGSDTPAGASQPQTLTLNWNGTTWTTVASPNAASTDILASVATKPGAAIVWAAGDSGTTGSFNPLILQNG